MAVYGREDAERGPLVLERISDLDEAKKLLGDFRDIRGMTVVNPNGDIVGQVDNLYMDPKQGKLVMASITFGSAWGIGGRHVLVPMDQIEYLEGNLVRVVTTPEMVKAAPEFQDVESGDMMQYHDYWCNPAAPPRNRKAA